MTPPAWWWVGWGIALGVPEADPSGPANWPVEERAWRRCEALDARAGALLLGDGSRGAGDGATWAKRAEACPRAPLVLVLAAQEAIVEATNLAWGTSLTEDLDDWVQDHRATLERALAWLDVAFEERELRGEPPPLEGHYFRAYALFALGRPAEARGALASARALADVATWRIDRMAALVELLVGELDVSLALARRCWTNAPPEDRALSSYVWALVLDRAGGGASARATLQALRRESGHATARRAVASLLPVHERIYLRALDHQANGERVNALRLWEAYLHRPEPIEADRELARRHLEELTRRPPPVGGPF